MSMFPTLRWGTAEPALVPLVRATMGIDGEGDKWTGPDVRACKEWQAEQDGLKPDGIVGSRVWDRLLQMGLMPPHTFSLIIGGRPVDVPFPVVHVPGLKTGRRKSKPDAIVVHNTVTSSAPDTFNVLERRGLSTHFEVDHAGTVYQYADPLTQTAWHASSFNRRSVGIDVTGPVYARSIDRADNLHWKEVGTAAWAPKRSRGKYLLHPTAQLEGLRSLLLTLSDSLGIPPTWPERFPQWGAPLPKSETRSPGIYAHGQISRKWCGYSALEPFRTAGLADWSGATEVAA